jgi:hypothetical protein
MNAELIVHEQFSQAIVKSLVSLLSTVLGIFDCKDCKLIIIHDNAITMHWNAEKNTIIGITSRLLIVFEWR